MADVEIPFQWLVAESVAPEVVDALTSAGVALDDAEPRPAPADLASDTDDAGFEPLLLIAGAAAIAYLARAISGIVRDHRHGGVVIDRRGPKLTVRERVRGVNAGTVVVVGDDGAQVFAAPDDRTLSTILGS
ncbi:hypothetical protein [Agromyces sp. ZXT2-6]|uniref:hypothetical protein n=1 Tax=Agromyces sp. ZXT2-6 TaxID=3461153 RepID=UPI004054EEE2